MSFYLYNGVRLPAPLPEWDKTTHPCAFMVYYPGEPYYALYYGKYLSYDYSADNPIILSNDESDAVNGFTFYKANPGDTEWTAKKLAYLYQVSFDFDDEIVWTNADILNSDGSVFLAATSPLPVGNPITDPLSFAMGWQLGQRLRMRGKKQWETLFEGEVTTTESGGIANASISGLAQSEPHFTGGETLAITYDGVKTVFNVQVRESMMGNSYYVGDLSLYTESTAGEHGYFVGSMFSLGIYGLNLATPTPAGTHTLKIERMVM